jgi:hypothetical protein
VAKLKIMYWKDIPCSIMATEKGEKSARRQLPEIYMTFVDTVAMKEGTTSAEDYQAAFRWGEIEERPGTPDEVADAGLAEVLEKYPRAWLMQRSRAAGPDLPNPSDPPDAADGGE